MPGGWSRAVCYNTLMPVSHLDIAELEPMADFIESVMEYLPEKDRASYNKAVAEARAGTITRERLLEMAKNVGSVTWPMRRTLDHFLSTVGAELEWEKVLEHVRPTTALLLKKLRESAGAIPLGDMLKNADASYLISPEQQVEIDMVREEARLDLWNEHKEHLATMLADASTELEAMKKRLKLMREQTLATQGAEQSNLLERLATYDDRIYFGGEAIPLELLDAELTFDAEEHGIDPEAATRG